MKKLLFAFSLVLLFSSCGDSSSSRSNRDGSSNGSSYSSSQDYTSSDDSYDEPVVPGGQMSNQPAFCSRCGGMGVIGEYGLPCDVCGGTGTQAVMVYPDYGAVPQGGGGGTDTRYVSCASCNGSGRCFMCDGTGWFSYEGSYGQSGGVKSCTYCDGRGNCLKCRGTGQVLR